MCVWSRVQQSRQHGGLSICIHWTPLHMYQLYRSTDQSHPTSAYIRISSPHFTNFHISPVYSIRNCVMCLVFGGGNAMKICKQVYIENNKVHCDIDFGCKVNDWGSPLREHTDPRSFTVHGSWPLELVVCARTFLSITNSSSSLTGIKNYLSLTHIWNSSPKR